jgi:hypothetical protein
MKGNETYVIPYETNKQTNNNKQTKTPIKNEVTVSALW